MQAKDAQLADVLDSVNMKNFPKCDLFWMISVLDKFDALLAEESTPRGLKEAILKFTKQLMDNSLNRSIYNSYEHLDKILGSKDLLLTRCTLDLLVRVAQRNNQQHGALGNFNKNLSASSVKQLVQFDYDSDTYQYYFESEAKLVVLNKASLTGEQEASVPEQHKVSVYLWKQPKSDILLQIRLLALAVYIWMTSESTASSLVDESWVTALIEQQPEALVVVESMFSWRGRVAHLLGVLQVGASHGVLMFKLKSIASLPEGYVDCLLSLINTVAQLKEGGVQLVQAELMQTSMNLLKEDLDIRVTSRLVGLLDQVAFTNNVTNSLEGIVAVDGFKIIAERVHRQLEFCLLQEQAAHSSDIEEPKSPNLASDAIPHEHVALFKSLLRFMIHAMQSHGGNDRVRTLIDGPLVPVVKQVIEKPTVFGAVLYAMSINLMGAFIHNDPTSYTVLQEKGVPQAFIQSLEKYPISPSFDLLFAIPNALGAVCLNADGLKEVIAVNPFGKFFEVFLSADHLRAMLDEDVSSALGNSFDELVRHHPDLKQLVSDEVVKLLAKLVDLAKQNEYPGIGVTNVVGTGLKLETGDPNLQLQIVDEDAVQQFEQSLQPLPIMNFIESISRFLMGYFTNEQHAKDLMSEDMMTRLVALYTSNSLPHDFAASLASYSLSNVLRVASSFNSQSLLRIILTTLKSVYQDNLNWIQFKEKKSVFVPFIDNPTQEHQTQYRMFVCLHALLGLLCDVYSQPVFSQSNVVLKVIEGFIEEDNGVVLNALCQIYGACALEIQFFRTDVSKELMGNEIEPADPSDKSAKKKFADPTDFRVSNVRYFKYLLTQSTAFIVPVVQGLSKMLLTKRMDAELYRLPAEKGAKQLIQSALTLLSNPRLPDQPGVVRFHYVQIAVGFCHTLCTDDRYVEHILTVVAAQFVKAGGLDVILKLLDGLCSYLSQDGNEDIRMRALAAVDIILKLVMVFCDTKGVMESAHTTNLLAKDGQALRVGSKFDVLRPVFNPQDFLVANRQVVLSALLPIVEAQTHLKIGTSNLQLFYKLIAECVKSDAVDSEVPIKKKPFESAFFDRFDPFNGSAELPSVQLGTHLTPTPAQPVQPALPPVNEAHVTQLIEMGFNRASALHALRQTGRNVIRAADYLLSHPPIESSEEEEHTEDPPAATQEPDVDENEQAVTDDGDENFEDIDGMDEDQEEDDDDDESETDTDADMSFNVAPALQFKKEHPADKKARAEAESSQQKLVIITQKFGELIGKSGVDLVTKSSGALQELKDIFSSLASTQSTVLDSLKKVDSMVTQSTLDSDEDAQRLSSFLQFFALMFQNDDISRRLLDGQFSEQMLDQLVVKLTEQHKCKDEMLLLVVGSLQLITEQAICKASAITEEGIADEGPVVKHDSADFIVRLGVKAVEASLKILSMGKSLNAQAVNCSVRLIALATRHYACAQKFIHLNGLSSVLKAVQEFPFHGQTSLLMIIMRHVFEMSEVLRFQFQQDMASWFTTPRARNVEIGIFLKNFAAAVCRDQNNFVDSVVEICRLSKDNRFSSIGLVGKENIKKHEDDATDKVEEHQQVLKSNNLKAQALLLESAETKQVIYMLMDRLMEHRQAKDGSSVSLEASTSDTVKDSAAVYQRCFTLQALSELFTSFHASRLIALSYSKSKSGKDKAGSYKGFKSFLLYLLTDLLPYQDLKVADSKNSPNKSLVDQSSWVFHLFSVLCSTDMSEESTAQERRLSLSSSQSVDYMTVRKITVEMTVRSIKEALQSAKPTEQRYGRLYALAVLLNRMLGVRYPSSPAVVANQYQESLTCRAMMEKNVVQLLTTVLSEVDLNYPGVKVIVDAILKTLEQLSRLANKLSKSSSLANSPKQSKANLLEHVTAGTSQTPIHLSDDFIRDSALGMFGSGVDVRHSTDSSDVSDEDEDMMDEGEDDYDSQDDDGHDDFTDISEESMPEDEDMDSNVDMEVVIRTAPVDGMEDYSDEDDSSNSSSDQEEGGSTSFSEGGDDGNNVWMDEGPIDEMGHDIVGEEEFEIDGEPIEGHEMIENMFPDTEDETEESGGEDEPEDVQEFDDDGNQFDDYDMDGGPEDFELINNPWGRGGGGSSRRHRRNNIPDYIRFAGQHEFGDMPDIDLQFTGGYGQPMSLPGMGIRRGVGEFDGLCNGLTLNDNIGQNPLLQSGPDDASTGRRRRIQNSMMNSDTRNAIQFLEQMLHVDARDIVRIDNRGGQTITATAVPGNADQGEESNVVNTECHPIRSSERWFQEARNIFGTQVNSQASRVNNAIVNRLLPLAKEAESKKKIEQEKQRQETVEKLKKDAEERRLKTEQQAKEAPTTPADVAPMDVDPGSASTISGSQITIHGTNVDLANSGIDVTFLEALPDDMRMDVIAQHLRQQADMGSFQFPPGMTGQFVDALPSDLQHYIQEQENYEAMDQDVEEEGEEGGPEQAFLNNLPEGMREFFRQPFTAGARAQHARLQDATPKVSKKSLPSSPQKEPVQLLDQTSVMTLLKLVFAAGYSNRNNHLHALIQNLCENGSTRNELLNTLVSIVTECSRSSLRAKATPKKQSSLLSITDSLLVGHTQEYRSTTSIDRALTLLIDLISRNDMNAQYFLNDTEVAGDMPQSPLSRRPSLPKKSKLKYPLMNLLVLMEHKIFLNNSQLMELLTSLIAQITKLIAAAASKAEKDAQKTVEDAKDESKEEEADS